MRSETPLGLVYAHILRQHVEIRARLGEVRVERIVAYAEEHDVGQRELAGEEMTG
jgi:hypothetical protein